MLYRRNKRFYVNTTNVIANKRIIISKLVIMILIPKIPLNLISPGVYSRIKYKYAKNFDNESYFANFPLIITISPSFCHNI